MTKSLTSAQAAALKLLRDTGGALDYQPDLFGFAIPGATRSSRVVMGTAKALIAAGVVHVTRTKIMRGQAVADRLELVDG